MFAATINTSDELMLCSACAKPHPIQEFRRRSKSSNIRARQCRKCHAIAERDRLRAKSLKAKRLTAQKIATQVARSTSFEHATNLINLLVSGMGGADRFFDFWFEEIERLKAQRHHRARLLRFFEMVFNAQVLWEGRAAAFRNRLDTPEGRAALREEVRRMVKDDPAFVAEAAAQMGCRLVWAEDVPAASTE